MRASAPDLVEASGAKALVVFTAKSTAEAVRFHVRVEQRFSAAIKA